MTSRSSGMNAGAETATGQSSTSHSGATSQSETQRQQGQTTQLAGRSDAMSGSAVALETEKGSTRISGGVVAKIAGLAARDIPGVFSMGSGMARRVGQLRSLIPGSGEAADQGVAVEVGQREAAIDLNIVTWYGQSIVDVSDAVRRNVVGQVEGMTGLQVIEVNIQVDDIHVEAPQEPQSESRVQ